MSTSADLTSKLSFLRFFQKFIPAAMAVMNLSSAGAAWNSASNDIVLPSFSHWAVPLGEPSAIFACSSALLYKFVHSPREKILLTFISSDGHPLKFSALSVSPMYCRVRKVKMTVSIESSQLHVVVGGAPPFY